MAEKIYKNEKVAVEWKPDLCIHSKNCFNGLPSVFDPRERPWVNINGADAEQIISQVGKCPSGALSIKREEAAAEDIEFEQIVEVAENGPLMVYGNIKVKHPDGKEDTKHKTTAFCRCGASSNKPYCDGSHRKIAFKG